MSSFKRVWTDMHIHIHIYIYISQLLESKKWENCLILVLTCFFSNSWNPKNGKNTSFGVDMFFSNSWSPKNGKTYILVLVLTCFSQTPGVQKMGKIISVGVVDMFFSQTFGVDMFFSNSCKSKNWENWLVLVLTDWNLEPLFLNITKILASHSKLLPNPPEMSKVLSSGLKKLENCEAF